MSLINDALKRAKQSQQNTPPPGASPLPPVEPPARRGSGSGWMLGLAAILFLAAAGLFLGTALLKRKSPPAETAKTPAVPAPLVAAQLAKPAAAPAPVAPPVSRPTQNSVTTSAVVSKPASNTALAMPVTNRPPAPPVEQLPKVQGIIFTAANPVAIVNGKAVNVGDDVGNFRVKQILKNGVVFQRPDGSLKTLNLGE